ncbi:MAG: hypothetical protein KGR70_16835 [Cyanobacteria bacterium REEB494]|nr:hypothetical protein [Cyanobacteria bacterium REEB494]
MKSGKQIIGARNLKKGEDTKALGRITFGKSRPDKTKYVLVDITYDEKTGNDLYECGMLALKHDREAVIEYVIKKALKECAEFGKKKK